MRTKIIKTKKPHHVRFRSVYWTRDIDEFKEKTHKYRKFFFRNVYIIQETLPTVEIGAHTKYLELRTFRKVFRCSLEGGIY